jgi:hypothetical protein
MVRSRSAVDNGTRSSSICTVAVSVPSINPPPSTGAATHTVSTNGCGRAT